MGGSVKKATKKFEKNKLKGELERRNARKPVKQRKQLVEKRKARRLENGGDEAAAPKKPSALQDMTMDEFFQGGVELPQAKPKKAAKKRKRQEQVEAEESDSAAAEELEGKPVAADSDDGSGSEEADGFEDHKGDLDALAQKDPEFYKYLQENDAELLDFGAGAEQAEPPRKKKKKATKEQEQEQADEEDLEDLPEDTSGAIEVTAAMVDKWKKSMVEQHSLTALRETVQAFRAAVRTTEDDEKTGKYNVSSPEVYHKLLVAALQHIPGVLNHHLPVKETAAGKTRISTDSKKFSNLSPVLNAYTGSILTLLGWLSDASTLKLTLSALMPLLPYILTFKRHLKNLLKAVLAVWAAPSHPETTRITAFLAVRRLAAIGDASLREAVLRSTYQALLRGSTRGATAHGLAAVNLMKNSAVELWGFDAALSYSSAFSSIRKLAVHLRSSVARPTKDSTKAVYNAQFVHALDFWSRVLAHHCSPAANAGLKKASDSPLHPLIYPLVQVTLGTLRLVPTPAYFPLRFQLTRALLRISRATRTYIPLAPALLEVLQSPELKTPPRPSTLRPLDFGAAPRAHKSYLRTRVYQDGAGELAVELLAEFFGVWAKSVAFPELAIPPTVLLKRWLKDVGGGRKDARDDSGGRGGRGRPPPRARGNANAKLNAAVALLVHKLAAHAAFVEKARAKVDFAVADRRGVDGFLADVDWEDTPLGAYVASLRRQAEERERAAEAGRGEAKERRERDEDMDVHGSEGDDGGEGLDEMEEDEDEVEMEDEDE